MHRTALALLPVALLALAIALPARAADNTTATHYRWKDTAGVVHFGDTIPADALAGGYDIVNNNGMVVRHVARELSPDERRAAQAAAAQAAAAKRAAEQQNLADAQMLAAYPTDKALADSQHGQLKQMQMDIATLQTNLSSQEATLAELLAHAADLQHAKKPIPPVVTNQIAEQRAAVNDERTELTKRRADLARTETRFAAQLARYRTLRAKYQGSTAEP